MVGTPIGGLRVDLQLNSAAFIRDIAKTNAAIATNTRAMQTSLTRLRTTANSVGAAFGAWITARTIKKVINFLDQSIDLAAKLDNELGRAARQWNRQSVEMKNAFQLGVAKGFLNTVTEGLKNSGASLQTLATAGIMLGNVLGRVFTQIVNFLTVDIPKGVNQSIAGINSAIRAYNALAAARDRNAMGASALAPGAAGSGLLGPGSVSNSANLPEIELAIVGQTKAWVDNASALNIASDAARLAAQSQKALGKTVTKTTEASKATTEQWLQVADTLGQAFHTMFKENKAVAIAQAVINTAQAITEALKLPFPVNWAQVAAVTALGAAQIATIASTEVGSSSKAIKKGSGSGKSAPAKAGAASNSSGGSSSPGQAVNITLVGESGFTREQVRALIGQMNEAIGDGATLRVSG